MDKNLALQKHEIQKVVHGEEKRFLEAIKDKTIRELPEEELRKAIKYAMVKIGLRAANWPEGVEKSLLLQHIWENFGDLTPSEFRIAFDWAIDGRFTVEINCYENFSCKYVTDILKAYKALKSKAFVNHEQKLVLYKEDVRAPLEPTDDFWNSEFAQRLEKAIPGLKEKYTKKQ